MRRTCPLKVIFRDLSIFAVVFLVSCRGSELRSILLRFAAIFCVFRAFSRFRSGFSRFLARHGLTINPKLLHTWSDLVDALVF